MELSQIRYFLAVAESLNFTNAAEACSVSQPALSKAIRKLEENLGAALFNRNSQQVELTEFGHTMRVHFERIEDSRRKAAEAAKIASNEHVEILDIGVMCTIGPRRFGRFLQTFLIEFPRIRVTLHDVTAAIIPELLLSGALDCVFCARDVKHDQRFQAVNLFEERMVVAFANGHRFSDFDAVPLADVAGEPYLDRLHCEFRDEFIDFTRASGLDLNITLRSEREDWILDLINSGMGVAVLPESSVVLDKVVHRPISDMASLRKLELVMTASGTVSPALREFQAAAEEFDWRP